MSPKQPHVYTIPYHVPFLSELVTYLARLEQDHADDQFFLSKAKILLPSRRAVREMQSEFLKSSDKKSLLPPKFMPIGDVDEDELDLSLLSLTDGMALGHDLPPVISSIDRRLILADLISKKEIEFSWAQCLDFAKTLARLMDQIYTENLNLSDLPELVPANDLSDHWKDIVRFLEILSVQWPLILQERGMIDASYRRNSLMRMLADYWRANPPQTPIIIAGSTGSIPIVADLMHVIAHLPQGAVILPGLDPSIPNDVWDALPASHPQSIMKQTIKTIGCDRGNVKILNHQNKIQAGRNMIRQSMYPPQFFLHDKDQKLSRDDINHIHLVETANEHDESLAIALILRQMMDDPTKKAIVITPDRNLARRISSELKRWHINVNDSAGQGLHTQKIAVFMGKYLSLLTEKTDLPAFLSFLKSPYFAPHLSADELNKFEVKYCRNLKIYPEYIDASWLESVAADYPFLEKFISLFDATIKFKNEKKQVSAFLTDILELLSPLFTSSEQLWAGDDGATMINYLQSLLLSDTGARIVDIHQFKDIIQHFWSEQMVRSTAIAHPNITILGQIEARLLYADIVIMAGLNEGVWPQDPTPDPWMSVFMRQKFGLPPIERQYALSAHDFMGGISAREVYMTRSERMNGTPAVPARWLQRIHAYIEFHGISKSVLTQKYTHELAPIMRGLMQVDAVQKIDAPLPRPPADQRPTSLYVTDVESLIKNPYSIYAKSILRVRPLRDLNDDHYYFQVGNLLHEIFETYAQLMNDHDGQDDELQLHEATNHVFAKYKHGDQSAFWTLFERRLNILLPSFLKLDRAWRAETIPYLSEARRSCDIPVNDRSIQLKAKADRVDQWKADGIAILDYKSGKAPSAIELVDGRKPQLPLEMVMASHGAFGDALPPSRIKAEFWHVPDKGGFESRNLEMIKVSGKGEISAAELINHSLRQFTELMDHMLNPATPFHVIAPSGWNISRDEEKMHHLARTDEWAFLYDGGDDATASEGDA